MINDLNLWGGVFPWPEEGVHKHSRGRLAIVGSSPSRTGATRLAARAGLRMGAGVVRMLCPPASTIVYAMALEAVILKPFADEDELVTLAGENDAMVIGPNAGVTEQTRQWVERLCGLNAAMVWDADAISAFEGEGGRLCELARAGDVLTPHTGEFERVFPGLLEERCREDAASEAARRTGAIVVLKGPRTAVASPDGRVAVDETVAPWLATAGSGDVLAGIAGALLAQKMPAFEAACAAVWLHSQAGAAFGPGLTAEDLPDQLPATLRRIYPGSTSLPTG